MISIAPANKLIIRLSGMTERDIVLNKSPDSLSLSLTPSLRGDDARWVTLTQAAYDALPEKNPKLLYLITG